MFQTTNQEFVSNYPQLLSPMFDREFPICLVKNLYLWCLLAQKSQLNPTPHDILDFGAYPPVINSGWLPGTPSIYFDDFPEIVHLLRAFPGWPPWILVTSIQPKPENRTRSIRSTTGDQVTLLKELVPLLFVQLSADKDLFRKNWSFGVGRRWPKTEDLWKELDDFSWTL